MVRFIIAIAILMAPQASYSYPTPVDFSGNLSRWPINRHDGPVTFELKSKNADMLEIFEPIVLEAAALWSDIPSSYFRYEQVSEEGQVTIELDGNFEDGDFSSGYAIFDKFKNGRPKHCTIKIAVTESESSLGVGKTVLHEMGHCLGLGHSLIPESIMSYKDEANDFRLDTDDIAAVSRLYPIDDSSEKLPPGCAVAGGVKGSTLILWLIFTTPLFFVILRKDPS